MASVDPAAATQPDPATDAGAADPRPRPRLGRGPAGVPGFGHTAEGAVAQLAAIDAAVLEAMSIACTPRGARRLGAARRTAASRSGT